jgi:hypothetical protein
MPVNAMKRAASRSAPRNNCPDSQAKVGSKVQRHYERPDASHYITMTRLIRITSCSIANARFCVPSTALAERFIKTGILPETPSLLEMPVTHTDVHYRRFAERCLRMAEICEHTPSAASLRQIAADYLDMANETANEGESQDAIWQLRPGGHDFLVSKAPKAGIVATIHAIVKRAIQSTVIIVSAILVGTSVFAALILATAPAGGSITSYKQVECMYREVASLRWPRDLRELVSLNWTRVILESNRSLDGLQRLCGWRSLRRSDTASGAPTPSH